MSMFLASEKETGSFFFTPVTSHLGVINPASINDITRLGILDLFHGVYLALGQRLNSFNQLQTTWFPSWMDLQSLFLPWVMRLCLYYGLGLLPFLTSTGPRWRTRRSRRLPFWGSMVRFRTCMVCSTPWKHGLIEKSMIIQILKQEIERGKRSAGEWGSFERGRRDRKGRRLLERRRFRGSFSESDEKWKNWEGGESKEKRTSWERKFLVFWIMLMAVSSNFVYNEMDSANKERKEEVPMSMCDQWERECCKINSALVLTMFTPSPFSSPPLIITKTHLPLTKKFLLSTWWEQLLSGLCWVG